MHMLHSHQIYKERCWLMMFHLNIMISQPFLEGVRGSFQPSDKIAQLLSQDLIARCLPAEPPPSSPHAY